MIIILIGLLLIAIGVYYQFPELQNASNIVIAFANIALVLVTLSSFKLSRESLDRANEANEITSKALQLAQEENERARRLYTSQKKPLLDITPIAITQNKAGTHSVTKLSVNNYSGFDAKNVRVDLRYGDYSWIGEWLKAAEDSKGKNQNQNIINEKWYQSAPNLFIGDIKSHETKVVPDEPQIKGALFVGSLNIENEICASGKNNSIPVHVRVSWENENGHVFDEVHKYDLVCTPAKNNGRSLTFISKGIKSQKN